MSTFVDFAELKQQAPITRVIELFQINVTKSGQQLRGSCPICNSNDKRAFVVTPAKGLWFCFGGCGGGDAIKLIAKIRNTDQRNAALEIQERAGTVTGNRSNGNSSNRPPSSVRAPSSAESGVRRAQGFDAKAYAERLDPAHESLGPLEIAPETLTAWKAGYAGSGVLRGRLALPLHRGKEIVGYFGLAIGDQQPRLLFPNGVDPAEFIFGSDKAEGGLFLLKDPLDVLKAHDSGIFGVCFLTESISPIQLEHLAGVMSAAGSDVLEIA